MKKILELWPVVVEIIFLWPLNVSWIVLPALRLRGVVGIQLFLIATALATAGLLYGWWFWGWLGMEIQKIKIVKEATNLGKETIADLRKDEYIKKNYLDRKKEKFISMYRKKVDSKGWLSRVFNKNGYLGIILFILAEIFVPGAREGGVILCRIGRWKRGFALLLLLNAVNMAGTVWAWSYFISRLGY